MPARACGHEGVLVVPTLEGWIYGVANHGRSEGNDAALIVEVRSGETRVPASFVLAQTQATAANKKLWEVRRMCEGKGRLMGAVLVTRGFSPRRIWQKTVSGRRGSGV